jgi:ElaB/YqjD/DUF883 family membrane-anchored ribosome-binding protein
METQHTRDMDKTRENEKNRDAARRGSENMAGAMTGDRLGPDQGRPDGESNEGGTLEQAKTMARNVGEQARTVASTATTTAQDLARRAREQTSAATDTLYQQGAQASEYLTRNVNQYPLTALLIAGAIGYGLGYLIHSGWTSQSWSWGDGDRREWTDRNANRRRSD